MKHILFFLGAICYFGVYISAEDSFDVLEKNCWNHIHTTANSQLLQHQKIGLFAAHVARSTNTVDLLVNALSNPSLEIKLFAIELCAAWPDFKIQKSLINLYHEAKYRILQTKILFTLQCHPHPLLEDFYASVLNNSNSQSIEHAISLYCLLSIDSQHMPKYMDYLVQSDNKFITEFKYKILFEYLSIEQILNSPINLSPKALMEEAIPLKYFKKAAEKIDLLNIKKLSDKEIMHFLNRQFTKNNSPSNTSTYIFTEAILFPSLNKENKSSKTSDTIEALAITLNYALSIYSEKEGINQAKELFYSILNNPLIHKLKLIHLGPLFRVVPLRGSTVNTQLETDHIKLLIASVLLQLDPDDNQAIRTLTDTSQSLIEKTGLMSFSLLIENELLDTPLLNVLKNKLPKLHQINIDLLISILKKDSSHLVQYIKNYSALTIPQKEKLLYAIIQHPSRDYIELLSSISDNESTLLESLKYAAIIQALKS